MTKWRTVQAEFVEWAGKESLEIRSRRSERYHAVLCDPPYGLHFMGKDWDRVSAKEWGQAMMPLLYPGAIVLMFGGTRTWHKLATGMEEAGFKVWDTLMWLHGQGFPKMLDIGGMISKIERGHPQGGSDPSSPSHGKWASGCSEANPDGRSFGAGISQWGGKVGGGPRKIINDWTGWKSPGLKPAWEPILCFAALRQGKNYAELAMEYGSGTLNVDGGRVSIRDDERERIDNRSGRGFGTIFLRGGRAEGKFKSHESGRYPANLVLDEESAEMLDEQTRPGKSGPSHFFYCAKASRSEREEGLSRRDDGKPSNSHLTVKPIALTKWLATLLLPPDSVKPRRLLVPFAGVASEMIGAMQAGWDEVVGVEQSEEYVRISRARMHYWGRKQGVIKRYPRIPRFPRIMRYPRVLRFPRMSVS